MDQAHEGAVTTTTVAATEVATSKGWASRIGRRWGDALAMASLVALVVFMWLPRLNGPINARMDGGVYYVLGTSLYEGKGYRMLSEPGEPRAVQYPPLLPLLVTAHEAVLGTTDFRVVGPKLRLTYFAMTIALALGTYLLARFYLRPPLALATAAAALMAQNPFVFTNMLYTELPFALMAVMLAVFNERATRTGSRTYGVLAGVTAVAAYLLRTAGLAFLVAWVVDSLLRRRFKQAGLRAVIAAAPVTLWLGYVASVTGSAEYKNPTYPYQRADYYYSNVTYAQNAGLINPFRPELGYTTPSFVLRRALSNVRDIPMAMVETTAVSAFGWEAAIKRVGRLVGLRSLPAKIGIVPLVVLGTLLAIGVVVLVRRRQYFVPLCFAMSVGLLCLVPWSEQYKRYLTPMVPFLALFVMVGVGYWFERSRELRLPVALVSRGAALAFVGAMLFADGLGLKRAMVQSAPSGTWKELDESLAWVAGRAAPGDVVVTTFPQTPYIEYGFKAVMPPMDTDPAEVRRLLDAVPVRWVVLDTMDYPDFTERYAGPAVRGDPTRWRLAYRSSDPRFTSEVYERVR